jgi:hypothetical protein
MTDYDKNNLMFLMQLTSKGLKDWFYQASEDDRLYAEELLAQGQIIAIDARVAQMQQFKEAKKVLAQFAL